MKYSYYKKLITGKIKTVNSFWLYFIPFIILSIPVLIQVLTNTMPKIEGYYSMHYVLTYDHGFVGRGLVGEILSWFFDVLTLRTIRIINVFFTEILVISASLSIGKALKKSRNDDSVFPIVVLFLLILCLGSFTVGIVYSDVKMDKLLLAIALFSVFISDNKYLSFLIPVFSIVSILINPVFCFTYFILIAVILFDKFQKSSYSFISGFFLITTCALVVFITGYATIAQGHLGFKDANEFLDYYFRRLDYDLSQDLRERFVNEWLIEYFDKSPKAIFEDTFNIYFIKWNSGVKAIISTLFLAIPFALSISLFWFKVIKFEKNKFKKFIFFICMISYLPCIPAIIISWEATKYYGCYLLVQMVLYIYFLNQHEDSVVCVTNKLIRKFKKYPLVAASAMCYFVTILMVK